MTKQFNAGLCDRLHEDNDKDHKLMWDKIDKVSDRVDNIKTLLIANLLSIAATLATIIIKVH
jgi:hypothetical protein